jgi:hypothetical protein
MERGIVALWFRYRLKKIKRKKDFNKKHIWHIYNKTNVRQNRAVLTSFQAFLS